jgi:hypothetical protein
VIKPAEPIVAMMNIMIVSVGMRVTESSPSLNTVETARRFHGRFAMKTKIVLSILVGAFIFAVAPLAASAQTIESQMFMVTPQDIKWGKGPPSLPLGAEAAPLYGDPARKVRSRCGLSFRRDIASLHTRIPSR